MSIYKSQSLFHFFWQIIKPYKWNYCLILFAPFLGGLTEIVFFYCAKLFVDALISGNLTYAVLKTPLFVFASYQIIQHIFWRAADLSRLRAEPNVRRQIINKSYDYVQKHSYQFFQNNLSGSIISKIKGIKGGYDQFFGTTMYDLYYLTVLIVGIIGLFCVSKLMGTFILLWFCVYFTIFRSMSTKMRKLSSIDSNCGHKYIGLVADKIANIFSIFAFAKRGDEFNDLYQFGEEEFIPKQKALYRYTFKFKIFQSFITLFMWSGFISILIYERKTNIITAGTVAFAFGIINRVAGATSYLVMKVQAFIEQLGDWKASFSILQMPHEQQDQENAKDLIIKNPSIEFNNVCFDYDTKDTKKVFNKLNLQIKSGENVGLVGYSGSGKSSLINLLLRYFDIESGKILIDDNDISEVTADSIRANISLIPQDTMLFHRNLMENIRYGRETATDEEVIDAAKKAHIHDYIEKLPEKYNTGVGERGIKLSGGQRQRIAIARAILKDSPILILDEATSSLDSKTERAIQESIHYILEQEGKTVIAIAHRLSTLKHMDRIVVLDKGKIVEEGSHDELIEKNNGLYKKLWDEQAV